MVVSLGLGRLQGLAGEGTRATCLATFDLFSRQFCWALAEVADQDYVAGVFAFGEEQLRAVAGPGEIEKEAGSEIGYGPWVTGRKWLLPDIGGAVSREEILQCLAIGGPMCITDAARYLKCSNGLTSVC